MELRHSLISALIWLPVIVTVTVVFLLVVNTISETIGQVPTDHRTNEQIVRSIYSDDCHNRDGLFEDTDPAMCVDSNGLIVRTYGKGE